MGVLVLHGYLGAFSRLMSDEFALFSTFNAHGFMDSYIDLFMKFSGRYSLNLTYNLLALTPVTILPYFTAGMLIFWLFFMTWAISHLMNTLSFKKNTWLSFLFGVIIIYASLDILPNLFQSVYWLPGMFTYLFPLVTMTIHIGILAYFLDKETTSIREKALALLAVFLFTVIACGFSETHALLVFMGFLAALFFVFIGYIAGDRQRRSYLMILLYEGLAGSLIAMLIQVLSPGTRVRESYFTPDHNILSVFYHSVSFTWSLLLKTVSDFSFTLLLVFSATVIFFMWHQFQSQPTVPVVPAKVRGLMRFQIPLVLLVWFLLIAVCMAPSFYATSQPPLDRTLTIPLFVMVLLIIFLGYRCSRAFMRFFTTVKMKQAVISFLIVVFVFSACGATYDSYKKLWRFSRRMKAYALDWEHREQLIQAAKKKGETEVTLPALRCFPMSTGLDEISTDPNFWVNMKMAEYYGIKSVKLFKKSELIKAKKRNQ